VTAARRLNELLARSFGVEVVRRRGVPVDDEWVQRFLWLDRVLAEVDGVEGDIAECGVAGGGSLAMLASLVRARSAQRHVYGFDTWSGLPAPTDADRGAESIAERGLFAWASPATVRAELRAHGFEDPDAVVTLVRGPFVETLPRFDGRLALLHIDADLYESYTQALRHLWPRLAAGGVAALDEYDQPGWPGARRAVDEFLASLPAGAAELRVDERTGKRYARKTD
jgi:hypothetical protein